MNFEEFTLDDLKNIRLCVALHVDKKGDPIFPDLLGKISIYFTCKKNEKSLNDFIDNISVGESNEENKE